MRSKRHLCQGSYIHYSSRIVLEFTSSFLYLLTTVAVATHAVLSQPASGNTASAETKIVSLLKSLKMAKRGEGENKIELELNNLLKELGVEKWRLTLSTGNSIDSYFICDSVEQLKELRGHYESGLMKTVLERIFSLLAGETITIHELKWPSGENDDRLFQLGKFTFSNSFTYSLKTVSLYRLYTCITVG